MSVRYTHLDKGLCPISWDETWGEPTAVGYDPQARETFIQFSPYWTFGVTTFRWRRVSDRELRSLEEDGLFEGYNPLWNGSVGEREDPLPLHIPKSQILHAYHPQAGSRAP